MNVNVRIEGMLDQILDQAIKEGLAKSKTEALRLGIVELNNKYNLLEQAKEEEYARMIDKARREISSGKVRTEGEKEFRKAVRG